MDWLINYKMIFKNVDRNNYQVLFTFCKLGYFLYNYSRFLEYFSLTFSLSFSDFYCNDNLFPY